MRRGFGLIAIAMTGGCSAVFGLDRVTIDDGSGGSGSGAIDGGPGDTVDGAVPQCVFAATAHMPVEDANASSYSMGGTLAAELDASGTIVLLPSRMTLGAYSHPRMSPANEIYVMSGNEPGVLRGPKYPFTDAVFRDDLGEIQLFGQGDELGTPTAAPPRHMVVGRAGGFEEYEEVMPDEWSLVGKLSISEANMHAPMLSPDGLVLGWASTDGSGHQQIRIGTRTGGDPQFGSIGTVLTDTNAIYGAIDDPFLTCDTLDFTGAASLGSGGLSVWSVSE